MNIGTEYFKRGIYCLFFSLQNAVCFIILMYLVPVLVTFFYAGCAKIKKIIPVAKSSHTKGSVGRTCGEKLGSVCTV